MRRLHAFLGLLLAAAMLLTLPIASADAKKQQRVKFGIADQHVEMFVDPRWQDLDLKITRYNVPWNAIDEPYERQRFVQYLQAAEAVGVEVLVHINGRRIDGEREPLPSVSKYRSKVRQLIALAKPYGVKTWGVWNEANHGSQPTFRRPDRAAQYFLAFRRICKGCKIVAADVLTQGTPTSRGVSSYRGWLRRFFKALGRRAFLAKIIGIHNYGELLESRGPYLSRDLIRFSKRYSRRAQFWLTESGGIAASKSRWCDLDRQVKGTRRMFLHAASLSRIGVKRLYMYNWTAHSCADQWDSGLIRSDGTARPALRIVEREAHRFARR